MLVTDYTLRKVMSANDQGILTEQVGLIANVKLHFILTSNCCCLISDIISAG